MLKPDRHVVQTEINLSFNGVAEAGLFMSYSTAGSGTAVPDEKAGLVAVAAVGSGSKVAGMLMHDFVPYNALLHRNWYKVTQVSGEKATLLRAGWVVTNQVAGAATPDAGKPAYLGNNGLVTDAGPGQRVGEFMGRLDEQGYCRLAVDLA